METKANSVLYGTQRAPPEMQSSSFLSLFSPRAHSFSKTVDIVLSKEENSVRQLMMAKSHHQRLLLLFFSLRNCGSASKESTCNAGELSLIPWVGKIPWLLTPVFWPGEFHGLYSPLGCKEWDRTE